MLEFTVDRRAMLEQCRAPHLRISEPRKARTRDRRPPFIPLPKFTSRQRTIIPWEASTRTNPPPNFCPPRPPKSRPPTPYTPRGYVFSPPQAVRLFRINNLQNEFIAPASKMSSFLDRFSVQFDGISRRFWHFWRDCGGPFAAGQRHRGARASLDANENSNEVGDWITPTG